MAHCLLTAAAFVAVVQPREAIACVLCRKRAHKVVRAHDCFCLEIYIYTPYDICIHNNLNRGWSELRTRKSRSDFVVWWTAVSCFFLYTSTRIRSTKDERFGAAGIFHYTSSKCLLYKNTRILVVARVRRGDLILASSNKLMQCLLYIYTYHMV